MGSFGSVSACHSVHAVLSLCVSSSGVTISCHHVNRQDVQVMLFRSSPSAAVHEPACTWGCPGVCEVVEVSVTKQEANA